MNYYWIGHCKEGTSDKVWGLIRLTNGIHEFGYQSSEDYVAFWGRRGKKLQTKIHKGLSNWDANKLSTKKENGGYTAINPNRLDEVYPEFEQDLEKTAVWALLSV